MMSSLGGVLLVLLFFAIGELAGLSFLSSFFSERAKNDIPLSLNPRRGPSFLFNSSPCCSF